MSTKRKVVKELLQRRVRARREASEELESDDSIPSLGKSGQHLEDDSASEVSEEDDKEDDDEDDDEDSSSEESESEAPNAAASISFSALAKAQASLSKPRKSSTLTKKKGAAAVAAADGWENNEALERKAGRKDHRDFNRSSKHAPTEISSKKAVSRKRDVVPIIKREARDPRFETLPGSNSYSTPVDDSRVRAAYSFLDSYREDEMKELKAAIKKAKNEDEKEKLKRVLMSMESRKKAQDRKDKEKEVLAKHRKAEKELVRQGKQPFYLKKAEQKKRVLLDQFGDLKGKQLDRVIERRRKKVEGKEKKKMPFARRGVKS